MGQRMGWIIAVAFGVVSWVAVGLVVADEAHGVETPGVKGPDTSYLAIYSCGLNVALVERTRDGRAITYLGAELAQRAAELSATAGAQVARVDLAHIYPAVTASCEAMTEADKAHPRTARQAYKGGLTRRGI